MSNVLMTEAKDLLKEGAAIVAGLKAERLTLTQKVAVLEREKQAAVLVQKLVDEGRVADDKETRTTLVTRLAGDNRDLDKIAADLAFLTTGKGLFSVGSLPDAKSLPARDRFDAAVMKGAADGGTDEET